MNTNWNVQFTKRAAKQTRQLSEDLRLVLRALTNDLINKGPAPGKNWQNYGKLKGVKKIDRRHCHLVKGNPTYVCCWEVDKTDRVVEVYYVGTHEKAPY